MSTPPKPSLESVFGELDGRLATKSGVVFTAETFANIPRVIDAPGLTITKTYQFVDDSWRGDVLNLKASKSTFRHLGLATLSVVFGAVPELRFRISDPGSEIKTLIIRYPGTTPRSVFNYETKPYRYEYSPEPVDKQPWMDRRVPDGGWPNFLLTFSKTWDSENWEKRDQLEGFGNDDASVLVASLFLNFGSQKNRLRDVRIEATGAYRRVSELSTGITLEIVDPK